MKSVVWNGTMQNILLEPKISSRIAKTSHEECAKKDEGNKKTGCAMVRSYQEIS